MRDLPMLLSLMIFFLTTAGAAQTDVCGDYVLPFVADDFYTRLTLNRDSTFQYVHHSHAIINQRENGRWKKRGDVLILSDCRTCNVTDPLKLSDRPVPSLSRPFTFKYVLIRNDSLFIIRPINDISPKPALIKKR
jgi:hypothetical protein